MGLFPKACLLYTSAIEVLTQTKIEIDYFSGVPSLYSDPELTEFFAETIKDNMDLKAIKDSKIMASEDMACVAEKVKTTYLMLNMKVKGCEAAHQDVYKRQAYL